MAKKNDQHPGVTAAEPDADAKVALKRIGEAKQDRANYEPLFQQCFDYAMPARQGFQQMTPGQQRGELVYDEIAVHGTDEFCSRLQSSMMPVYGRWIVPIAGSVRLSAADRKKINALLMDVNNHVFEVIHNSNLNQEVHEAFHDLAVGTGILRTDEGTVDKPIKYTAVPITQAYLEAGPFDDIGGVTRPMNPRISDIKLLWPKAKLPERLRSKADQDERVQIFERCARDYSQKDERHDYMVLTAEGEILYRFTYKGDGANPYAVFRWSKCAGETWGRGPLLNALAAIKTVNLALELMLENAQMQIAGMWKTDDADAINEDNLQLVPGTVIGYAPGTRGLEPLNPPGRPDFAQLIIKDQRYNINKALFNESLGNPEKTPMTATEVAERMADLSRQIGSAFGRLQTELLVPVYKRVVYILKKQGRIEVPKINGHEIKLVASSPLALAQKQQDVVAFDRFCEVIANRFGPQALNVIVKQDSAAGWLAENLSVPAKLLRDKGEIEKMLKDAQAALAAQNAPPTPKAA